MPLNQPQLNAIIRAATIAVATTVTVGSLGYLGAGVLPSTDYTFNYLHSNALLDTRGFTTLNSGAGNPTLDANGLPTGSCTLCVVTAPNSTTPGPLPPGNYWLNVKSASGTTTATVSSAGSAGITLGTGVLQPDGQTIRYPFTLAQSNGTVALNFNGVMTAFPDLARDGSTSTVGQPLFSNVALAYYSQFSSLRLMDFLNTNTRGDTTWSTRPGPWAMHAYAQPYSWEKAVAFVNAVANYQGSKLQTVFLNIPGFVDADYVSNLSALLTSQGLTSAVKLDVQVANEHWNTQFVFYNAYQALAMTETQCLSNYGVASPLIASIVSDGTKLTFTTVNPVDSSYLSTTANCVVVGGSGGGFSLGTVVSPVVATKTGTNTFTIPTTNTYNGTGQMGVIFNLTSTLVADNNPPNVAQMCAKWYVRLTRQFQQAWSANRPQDRFFIETAKYGGAGAGASNFANLIEFPYAAYLGGGSTSWLYGAAIGFYASATSASTTVDAVIAELQTVISGYLDGVIRTHVYNCKQYGLHPMAYEAGPDLQNVPNLNVAVNSDPRMTGIITSMLDTWFSNGGEHICVYHASPAAYYNGGNAQGAWSFLQSYTDLTAPKYLALIAYPPKSIRYANFSGSPGAVDIPNQYQYSVRYLVVNGLLGWYENGHTLDMVIAIPMTGSYTFTLKGLSKNAGNVVTFWLDPTNTGNGTPAGTSTLVATGGGWNVDPSSLAADVPDPITLQLTAGIHTIRMQAATCGSTGAGVLTLTGKQN